MFTNINGLRNNINELKYVVRANRPKVIFLNETHLTSDCDIGGLNMIGYDFVNSMSHSKHTGGVCVYISKDVKYGNVSIESQLVAWFVSIEIYINRMPTTLAGVYLSSNCAHKKQALDNFEQWFERISVGKSIMICGDFNLDMISMTTHGRRLRDFCDDNGMKQIVNSPTRITENTSTLIDLCLTNISMNKIMCNVSAEHQISDHAIMEIRLVGQNEKGVMRKKRRTEVWKIYNKFELWQYIEDSMHSWCDIEYSDVNTRMNWFIDTVKKATTKFKEIKEIATNQDFFDSDLEIMRREKNRLYKIAQHSTNVTDVTANWHEYRKFKNEYKKSIQIKKYEFNQRKLNRVQGNNKATWKVLNSILNKENNEITQIKIDGVNIEEDKEITNQFNAYFINSIVELNQNIPDAQYEDNIAINQDLNFEFSGVSIAEIKTCLRELKNNTDEFFMNPTVLLDAMFVIGQQLANIINQSFDTGIFPDILKKSTIVPIQKKPGSIIINDHRPINMLPCCERLIESLAYNQLTNYIDTNNILNRNQSGFRAKHSCETAINDIFYEWKAALNDSKIIIAVFLDFQRAFETIDPDILIKKLAKYGVSGASLRWFRTYLTNRRQTVKLGETVSNELYNGLGVPQGSILGPLLFILYINDLPSYLIYCIAKLFADDTLIYIISDSLDEAMGRMNYDLNTMYNKLCQNKLKLNVSKTKVMVITNRTIDRSNVDIFMNGTRLDIESEMKYLGIIIDDKLTFGRNISYVCKKVGQRVNVLNRLRNELDVGQKLTLYRSIIEPHFNYCPSILFLSNVTDLNRLQVLQNKCLRQILRANSFTEGHVMRKELNLMSVVQIVTYGTLIFIYKIVNGSAPNYLTEKIRYKHEFQINN